MFLNALIFFAVQHSFWWCIRFLFCIFCNKAQMYQVFQATLFLKHNIHHVEQNQRVWERLLGIRIVRGNFPTMYRYCKKIIQYKKINCFRYRFSFILIVYSIWSLYNFLAFKILASLKFFRPRPGPKRKSTTAQRSCLLVQCMSTFSSMMETIR